MTAGSKEKLGTSKPGAEKVRRESSRGKWIAVLAFVLLVGWGIYGFYEPIVNHIESYFFSTNSLPNEFATEKSFFILDDPGKGQKDFENKNLDSNTSENEGLKDSLGDSAKDQFKDLSSKTDQNKKSSASMDESFARESSEGAVETPSLKELENEPPLQPISGWIYDQNTEPVKNLKVVVSSRSLAEGNGASSSSGVKEETRSDSLGQFNFEELPDGEYLLRTEKTRSYESINKLVRAGVTSLVLQVKNDTRTPVTINGVVTDGEGQPLADVRVAASGQRNATTTDNNGVYLLQINVDDRERNQSVRFTLSGYRTETRGIPQSQLRETPTTQLNVQLKQLNQGVPVYGYVLDENSIPVGGAKVRLFSQIHQGNYNARTLSDGFFEIDDVEIGDDYRLWVRPKEDFKDYFEDHVAVRTNNPERTIFLEPMGRTSIQGRMLNVRGKPLSQFTLWMSNTGAGASKNLAVTGDKSGRFQVNDVPAGVVNFSSKGSPKFSFSGIQLESGEIKNADLVVDWGNDQLAGNIISFDGEPVSNARVKLFWSGQMQGITSHSQRQTITNGNGHFLFTELGPGGHTLSISAPGYRSIRREEMPTTSHGALLITLEKDSAL